MERQLPAWSEHTGRRGRAPPTALPPPPVASPRTRGSRAGGLLAQSGWAPPRLTDTSRVPRRRQGAHSTHPQSSSPRLLPSTARLPGTNRSRSLEPRINVESDFDFLKAKYLSWWKLSSNMVGTESRAGGPPSGAGGSRRGPGQTTGTSRPPRPPSWDHPRPCFHL